MLFITQDKTNWKFIGVVLILSIFVGAGVLWFAEKEKALTELLEIKGREVVEDKIAEFVPDQVEEWETYNNKEHGFEIKHPQGYSLRDITDYKGAPTGNLLLGKTEDVLEKEHPEWIIRASLYNPRPEDLLVPFEKYVIERVKMMCSADGPTVSIYCTDVVEKESFITAQGIKGYRIYLTEINERYEEKEIEISERIKGPLFVLDTFQHTNLSYIVFFELTEFGEINKEENLEIFVQLLNTFRLLE